jgi:hypothetical protein
MAFEKAPNAILTSYPERVKPLIFKKFTESTRHAFHHLPDQTEPTMKMRSLLASLAIAGAAMPASAFDRPFPDNVRRGTMTPDVHPTIVLDGKTRTLSPAARIWNQDNLIEQPASLRGERFAVNYTVDANGEIDRVWILTRDEASQPIKAQQGK